MTHELPELLRVYSECREDGFAALATIYGYTELMLAESVSWVFEDLTEDQYAYLETIKHKCSTSIAHWSVLAEMIDCEPGLPPEQNLHEMYLCLLNDARSSLTSIAGRAELILVQETLTQRQSQAMNIIAQRCKEVFDYWDSIGATMKSLSQS
jgi:hypothetical protein